MSKRVVGWLNEVLKTRVKDRQPSPGRDGRGDDLIWVLGGERFGIWAWQQKRA